MNGKFGANRAEEITSGSINLDFTLGRARRDTNNED